MDRSGAEDKPGFQRSRGARQPHPEYLATDARKHARRALKDGRIEPIDVPVAFRQAGPRDLDDDLFRRRDLTQSGRAPRRAFGAASSKAWVTLLK